MTIQFDKYNKVSIIDFLKSNNIKREEVAEKLNYPVCMIDSWYRGTYYPSDIQLKKILLEYNLYIIEAEKKTKINKRKVSKPRTPKPIVCITTNETYVSISEMSRKLNISLHTVYYNITRKNLINGKLYVFKNN